MLAKATMSEVWGEPAEPIAPSVFPLWGAYHAEPNREQRSADLVEEHGQTVVYWPHYSTQVRCGSRRQRQVFRSVIPGVLFAPKGTFKGSEDPLLGFARLHPVNLGRYITAREIEVIREIEGKLNIREAKRVRGLLVGDRVRFANDVYAAFLGEGEIMTIAPGGRISLKIDGKLFGGKDTITVTAAELELL